MSGLGRAQRARLGNGIVVIAALAVTGLGGCGRVGPPVAPERRLPYPVADLHGFVHDDAIELTWTTPSVRVDGTRLRDLSSARVFRAEDAGTGEPRAAVLSGARIPGYTEVATIPLGDDAPTSSGPLSYVDRRGLQVGQRYTYVALTVDDQGRISAPSSRASITYIAAPASPRDLKAEAGDKEARLTWAAPASPGDGTEPEKLGYEVFRAVGPDAALVPIGRTSAGVTELIDRGLQNDLNYSYAVRAVRSTAGTTAYGPLSGLVAVTPVDTTPPAPPTDLTAVPSVGAVRLSWRPSPDPDVAVYIVHRAESGREFLRIGSARPPAVAYTDRDVPSGRYQYVVTAQDAGSRANESERSNVVTVTVP
jgi:uncharacterized protein